MRLIHLIVFANGLLNQLVHSHNLEGTFQPKEWLLQELNGAHLRLSAIAVGFTLNHKNSNSRPNIKIRFPISGSTFSNGETRF